MFRCTLVAAVLSLVAAAEGSVRLELTPSPLEPLTWPSVGSTFDLDVLLRLSPDHDVPVTQVSYSVATNQPGALYLSECVILSDVLTDPTTPQTLVIGLDKGLLNPKHGKDLGVTSFDGATGVAHSAVIQRLSFTVLQPLPAGTTLSIVGPGFFERGTWGDADFNSYDLPITTIPEPASLASVACCAMLIARRRR